MITGGMKRSAQTRKFCHYRCKGRHFNGKYYDPVTAVPGFTVEPYSVDHSAYDAYMFLVEAADPAYGNGKRVILHTGDFRGHGSRADG